MKFQKASDSGSIEFDTAEWGYEEFQKREWIETTGTGAFCSSTLCGDNTRRYHGILIAGDGPDDSRQVLLSRLDELIVIGEAQYELATRTFHAARQPKGFQYIRHVRKSLNPEITYELPHRSGSCFLQKSILALHGSDTVAVIYRFSGTDQTAQLVLEPFVAFRDYHSLREQAETAEFQIDYSQDVLRVKSDQSKWSLSIKSSGAVFEDDPDWFHSFNLKAEKERGYDHTEALFRPGRLEYRLKTDQALILLISKGDAPKGMPEELVMEEYDRRRSLISGFPVKGAGFSQLALAADQFLVRHSDGTPDIIAGYPWFTCWGRDTMISLPGLCLSTGREADAREILQAWFKRVHKGLVPNRLGVKADERRYNTVDATLWMFVAAHAYLSRSGDLNFFKNEVLETMMEIIDWHFAGTEGGIRVDPDDGLLAAGSAETQLTWMDAYYNGTAVTPRYGKAVEINALWFNALKVYLEVAESVGGVDVASIAAEAKRCRNNFGKTFWNSDLECLFDVVEGPDSGADLRPNQLFAISLPFPLLGEQKAKQVLKAVRENLLTPVGLRTLAPEAPDYSGRYEGDLRARDMAYHQGTVWPWLLGPYAAATARFGDRSSKRELSKLINLFIQELSAGGIGSFSEVYDGDEPRLPRGCVAQAWSVAEVLRALTEC